MKLTWIYCIDCMKEEQAIVPICTSCGEETFDLGSDYQEFKTHYTHEGKPIITVIEKVA